MKMSVKFGRKMCIAEENKQCVSSKSTSKRITKRCMEMKKHCSPHANAISNPKPEAFDENLRNQNGNCGATRKC